MTNHDEVAKQHQLTSTAYGSDLIADMLRAFDIPYLTINPGASFRGLHDSIVNHLGNASPRLVLTLHEAQAVAMAHGYAKVTGKPMGVVLHANVGLMNAVMAIYNAYTDRVPMLILGATGAVDAARRRPWIEWVHTSRDQAAIIRPFVKWDDQPASVEACLNSLIRAWSMTQAIPTAPTYVCLDVDLQEAPAASLPQLDLSRFSLPSAPSVSEADLEKALQLMDTACRPLLLVGRYDRSEAAWQDRIELADRLQAAVICDQKVGVGFPSAHPAFVAAPAQYPDKRTLDVIADADLIVSLDWPDISGILSSRTDKGARAKIISISPDERLHNGWSFDHFAWPPATLRLPIKPETFTNGILKTLKARQQCDWSIPARVPVDVATSGDVTVPALIAAFDRVRADREVCLTRLTFGTPDSMVRFTGPLDCIGMDGGGGIGSTPGITVGVALALRGSGRIPVAILGDGDLLMGCQALWTAAAERLPCLFIVNNNASFYNDVEHQETIAIRRNRSIKRKYIGMAIADPEVNICDLAGSYGLKTFGTVTRVEDLEAVLEEAFKSVEAGNAVLVDVKTLPPERQA